MNKIETDRIDPNEDTVEPMRAHHARFLGFLTARVEDTETAEDILRS